MFSSAKMSTVKNMNVTNMEYHSLLSNTRSDISFVAIVLACWVIMILFLSRRYKVPPHNYTICLALSQLLLCFSFVLIKLDSFISCCKGFEVFLITTFLFATHCWTALLAFALASLRCTTSERPFGNTLTMYIIGWGLPACCSGIVVLILRSDFSDYMMSDNDFFHFFTEKKTYLAFWVTIQFIAIPICVGSLVWLYRCDTFCKCEMTANRKDEPGEETPLLSKHNREKCPRCKNSENCSSSLPDQSECGVIATCNSDIEDVDAIYSMIKSADHKSDHEEVAQKGNKLELDKYYEGEQHQSGRHVVVIVCQILLMIVCVFYCMWILVGDQKKSGIFLEVQLLVTIILSAQILVVFAAFGFERALVIDPLLQKVRRLWYGVDEVILPQVNELLFDEYHICQQFVHYHKKSCIEALFLQESSLDSSLSENSCSQYFLGSQLVDWLLEVGLVADRITAVHYGNSLLRGRVIRHSKKRYYFRDSSLTYEFCPGWDSSDGKQERS